MPRLQSIRGSRLRSRRRGYALIVALALLALGMGAAVVMLRTSDLSVRSTVRDDLNRRASRAAESALQTGLDVIRRRSWSGVNTEFSNTWLDGAAFRVRYLAGDASLSPSSAEYAYYPYRVTVEATATVSDPSDPTAITTSVATAVVELVPKKLQGPLSDYGERNEYAFYQLDRYNSNGEVKLDPPFQFDGKTRFNDPIAEWAKEYFQDDSRRQPYLSGLKTMAQNGVEHRPFAGPVEYKTSAQPSHFRTDVTSRLGQTEVNVSPEFEWTTPTVSATSYRLYPGGPAYNIQSFNATYGSSPQYLNYAANPVTNPLGLMRLTSSTTFKRDVQFGGMLLPSNSSVSLTVEGSRCTIAPPKAMSLDSRTLGLALPSLCVTDKLSIKKEADDVFFRGAVICWEETSIEEGYCSKDILFEGGLQSHDLIIRGRLDFKNFQDWNGALTSYNSSGATVPFPQYLETNYGLPSEPSIKIKKDVAGATAKFVFDPSRTLYDYPDGDSGLNWRIVSLTPPQ